MREVAVALALATLFVFGRADTFRMQLGSKELLEKVMFGALHSGLDRRQLSASDLGTSILNDVANAATQNPATLFSNFVQSIVSQSQDFSQFDQSQLGNLNLGALGALDVNDPIMEALTKLSQDKPSSIQSVEQTIENLVEEFCDPATCTASSDPSSTTSSCTGKSATLALEPWSCTLNDNVTALECTPAVLVLQKIPASCSLSAADLFNPAKFGKSPLPDSITPSGPVTYTGKSCQVTKNFGQATTNIYGADPFSLNLGALLNKGIPSVGSGSGSASVQLAGNVVGNATATGGR